MEQNGLKHASFVLNGVKTKRWAYYYNRYAVKYGYATYGAEYGYGYGSSERYKDIDGLSLNRPPGTVACGHRTPTCQQYNAGHPADSLPWPYLYLCPHVLYPHEPLTPINILDVPPSHLRCRASRGVFFAAATTAVRLCAGLNGHNGCWRNHQPNLTHWNGIDLNAGITPLQMPPFIA